jgi:integral membrane protein
MLDSAIGRLRLIGYAEGISLIVLLCIAMPLKYFAGKPEPVRVIGWIHGVLFVLFVVAAFVVYVQKKWPIKRFIVACLAAFLPLGTFVFDAQLKKEQTH